MEHHYTTNITWTGNNGSGTSSYKAYERSHVLSIDNKNDLPLSSDTPFRGEGNKHNPEDFLVASLSSCHMLWYLHLCADAGILVEEYTDQAEGILQLHPNSPSKFSEVVLHPKVVVKEENMIRRALELHHEAHSKCFIANSVNFPVRCEAQISSLS